MIVHLHGCAKARPKAPRRRPRALHAEAYNAPAVAWHSRGGCSWACTAPAKGVLKTFPGRYKLLQVQMATQSATEKELQEVPDRSLMLLRLSGRACSRRQDQGTGSGLPAARPSRLH